ncbi:hypothetical protein [Methylomonas denitrificans]|nr:hypothetical protein [Methylomonas denitrificans]
MANSVMANIQEINMNKVAKQDSAETHKGQVVDITGNSRNDDMAMEPEDDLRMTAGKDRVGFVAVRRNAKKSDKNDRY